MRRKILNMKSWRLYFTLRERCVCVCVCVLQYVSRKCSVIFWMIFPLWFVCVCVCVCLQDPLTRAKKAVHRLVERVGFFGILLCASVGHTCTRTRTHTCTHTHTHTHTGLPLCRYPILYLIWLGSPAVTSSSHSGLSLEPLSLEKLS